MNRSIKIILAVVSIILVAAIVVAVVALTSSKSETKLESVNSAEDLVSLMDRVYEGQEGLVPNSVQTQVVDINDDLMVKSYTGLDNGDDLQYLAVSEPMISSQAYSFVLLTVKDGVNTNEIAEAIKDKVDYRKWICVSAEKVYTTSSGNVVCLVMSSEEIAKPIYEKFKTLAGTVGQEYEKTEEIELPPEMY